MAKTKVHPSFEPFTKRQLNVKTLMFALEPDPRSLEYIKARGLVMSAKQRKAQLREAKAIVDDVYRDLIADKLEAAPELLDGKLLDAYIQAAEAVGDAQSATERYELAGEMSKAGVALKEGIAALFAKDELYKASPAQMVDEVVPARLRGKGRHADAARLEELSMQSSYYTDYKQRRDWMLEASQDAGTGTVADRVVEDNLPILMRNFRVAAEALELYPEAAEKVGADAGQLLEELGRGMWPSYFAQSGIDGYNALVGGLVGEGGVRVPGLNQALSEAWDADKSRMRRRPKLARLKKMVLSKAESLSASFGSYEDDEDMAEEVRYMVEAMDSVVDVDTGEVVGAAGAVEAVFKDAVGRGFDGVVVGSAKGLGYLSRVVLGRDAALHNANETCREGKLGPYAPSRRKELRLGKGGNMLKSGVPMGIVVEVVDAAGADADWRGLEREARACGARYDAAVEGAQSALSACTETSFLQNDAAHLAAMVELCASVNAIGGLSRVVALADAGEDLYARYETADGLPLSALLREANRMTGRVRSHLTKAPYSHDHWEVDFGNPKLGAGWDVNKTAEYGNMLLMRGGRYYYGIIARGVDGEGKAIRLDKHFFMPGDMADCWDLARVKYNPSAAKMLAKMFQGKAGAKYGMPDELAYGMAAYEGADGKKHRRYDEDPDFLCELIAAVSARITGEGVPAEWVPDGWENFSFDLKDPAEYASWAEFVADVDAGGYSVWTAKVTDVAVQHAVDEGQLYLFEITNADMRRRQAGTKRGESVDLYSRLLEELVSPDAADRRIRLAGGTQVFFRPASIERPAVHKAGSWLVNRTYVDPGDGIRKTVPEHVRREIFAHLNRHAGFEELSEEAGSYLDLVGKHKASHDIMRDARFARDAYELHICAMINHRGFTASDSKSRGLVADMDSALVERVVTQAPPVLAVARGERCLAYAVLTDPDGGVLGEWDLSVIDGFDYRSQLVALYQLRNSEEGRWQQKTKIANARRSYIQRLVAWVARKAVETGAVVAVEAAGEGFKDKRGFFEPQVWDGFSIALVDKLSCMVTDAGLKGDEPGSPTNPLQLASPWASYASTGSATGNVIHVPAAYIADVDLGCGYAPVMARAFGCSTGEQAEAAIRAMRSLRYEGGAFVAEVAASDFAKLGIAESFKADERVWQLTSKCGRKALFTDGKKPAPLDVTASIAKILTDAGVDYESGKDLRDAVCEQMTAKAKRALCEVIRIWLQVRNGWGDASAVTASPVVGGEASEPVERHKARALALKAIATIGTAHVEPVKGKGDKPGRWRYERVMAADWLAWLASRA